MVVDAERDFSLGNVAAIVAYWPVLILRHTGKAGSTTSTESTLNHDETALPPA